MASVNCCMGEERMKNVTNVLAGVVVIVGLLPGSGACFDSGSTGADGDFNPQVNTEVQLPPNGVLNYRSVNIPVGVTVRFKRNATNTPVTMLVAGDVVIAGTINLAGEAGPATGPVAGNSDPTDDGLPGKGGPGGYDGGYGGLPTPPYKGGKGLGPGGGGEGNGGSGGGAGHASVGGVNHTFPHGSGGIPYGTEQLLPLIGGSGGGGGSSPGYQQGGGGGGGGGAIQIAATGTVMITGSVSAAGGDESPSNHVYGGAGSGGAIKIVATTISGRGTISAIGGRGTRTSSGGGGSGSAGRIRLEADHFVGVGSSDPAYTFGLPGPVFLTGQPALRFSTIAGIPVPQEPTGSNDLTIPTTTANPVTLALATSGIPPGSVIKVTVIPRFGQAVSLDSPPTAGTVATATTSVSMDIPGGHNVLSAETTYTVIASVGDSLSRFAQGERVEKITLSSTLGKGSQATLHTPSGREFPIEPALLALAALPY